MNIRFSLSIASPHGRKHPFGHALLFEFHMMGTSVNGYGAPVVPELDVQRSRVSW